MRNVEKADLCFDEALNELGWTKEELHLKSQSELAEFRQLLEVKLSNNDVSICFEHATSSKYKLDLSGNASGIVSSYLHAYCYKAWHTVTKTKDEIAKYLKENPDKLLLKSTMYPGNDMVSPYGRDSYISSLNIGTEFSSRGIGSQASIVENTTDIKMDDDGNILVDARVLIYD